LPVSAIVGEGCPSTALAFNMPALYRAKYMVGEVVSRITRTALTLGGAHGIFKTSRLEQLFRDGALGPLHPPPSDFCLYNIGLYELGIDPRDVLPPMKPA
jgi:alkylation response protein AidB-like acyl-CoA dehydrogenase